ncbi:hypothetical protein QCA50_020755 [Cerrena zonata]|uniref:AB hydrolase-1 domain-containing protein n=1 Tax=Cerrena zonata TaxID=2478898 RepID=A0AAW0F8P7_9APHY
MATINPTEEGTIDFTYQGETYQTWYKVYGDIKNSSRTPLVVLHGGPGMSHDYLIPMSDLTPLANIPTIFYDQVGNARSTHIKDKPKTFWSAEIFVEELENLLKHFGISESFDLYGHSWGGILATEFEVRKQPAGLRKTGAFQHSRSVLALERVNETVGANFPCRYSRSLGKWYGRSRAISSCIGKVPRRV